MNDRYNRTPAEFEEEKTVLLSKDPQQDRRNQGWQQGRPQQGRPQQGRPQQGRPQQDSRQAFHRPNEGPEEYYSFVYDDGDFGGGQGTPDPKRGGSRKGIIIGVVIAVLLIAGFVCGKAIASWMTDDKEAETEVVNEDNENLTALESWDVQILDSDWDWDSKEVDDLNDQKQVYAILLVENNSEQPIVKLDFTVPDEDGEDVTDAKYPEYPLSAWGYIKNGQKGVMVADIHLERDADQLKPSTSSYTITQVYANENIDSRYEVPSGSVTAINGPNEDDYDIEISNPNEDDTNQNALLVAAKIRNDEIKTSDATGILSTAIPGRTKSYQQQHAFTDPNLPVDREDLVVYAVDRDYFKDTE